jgi:alkaline phosphatase D
MDKNSAPEIYEVSTDGCDGFAASRRRITQGWVDANVRNAVVLAGDVHRNWANDVKMDYEDRASPVVCMELVRRTGD